MKRFTCVCGHPLFFDSHACLNCGRAVGFQPQTMDMRPLMPDAPESLQDEFGQSYRRCANGGKHGVCNWLLPAAQEEPLCFACNLNRTIPNLDNPANVERWRKLEMAKKRLLYTLLTLGLPLQNGTGGMRFDFVEDIRSNPDLVDQALKYTGYSDGVITVNVIEADDAARESEKHAVNEQYRTLLGHLRHESGHHYLTPALQGAAADFRTLFGDERVDYGEALTQYYDRGPADDWRERCISAYASAHPIEDWAETWGHYLHIHDVLETAATHRVIAEDIPGASMDVRISTWRELSITLNELNRSIGHGDAYPFVVTGAVEAKLAFVDAAISRLRTPP